MDLVKLKNTNATSEEVGSPFSLLVRFVDIND